MEIYLPPWILLLLPRWILIYQHFLRDCQKLQTKTSFLINICWRKKNQESIHQRHRWHCIVCNTDSPIHIHKFIPSEVWKAFNVGINAWNIIAVLDSNGDRTTWICHFSWRSFHIHFKVYKMWPTCYFCWFNWRNCITCTHCNVISLEHDWIPQWANSQRINVDATTFPLLWQLYMIIEIFSRKFAKNQPNMDSFCFVRLLRLIWQIPRRHHLATQYQAFFFSSLQFLKIYLKPSTYIRNAVMKNRTLNHPPHYWIKPIHVMDTTSALISSTMMSTMTSKKNCWCCLRVIASLVFGNSTKKCFVFWWK